jgi:hypothetical protein
VKKHAELWFAIGAALWLGVMASAYVAVWRYKTTPGETSAKAPPRAPAALDRLRTPGRATVVMLAHPKCPCTRASIAELAVLMSRVGDTARAVVLFMTPAGGPGGWDQGESFERARAIPGVAVATDAGGVLAAELGASVSGHTIAYDASGRLLFSGGITASRGHVGDNAGRLRLEALLRGSEKGLGASKVFGCGLQDPEPIAARQR